MISECSGCCSYLVGSGNEFNLVDPLIDVERFTKSAQLGDGKIIGVIDTHVHADHLSGSRKIQKLTGCPLYMNKTSPVNFPFTPLAEKEYQMAESKIRVIHTPGHAPEHVSLLVDGRTVLTGDTLLVGDVGRVDLGRGDAGKLYDSLFSKLLALEEHVAVMPGHVGKAHFVSAGTSSTIELERQTNPALQVKTKDEFIKYMTEGWPPKPNSYELYVKVNSGLLELRDAKF
jgi:glyoxylase-like metal-dependent hydrolase (beta-lactamase superfamily II)